MALKQVFIFLSLYPLLGQCCSCPEISSRYQTLKNGICGRGDVYSAVVVGATCNCLSDTVPDSDYECRTYSYSPSNDSYSTARFRCGRPRGGIDRFATTCMQTENNLAPGVIILPTDNGTVENGTRPNDRGCRLACPFHDMDSPEYIPYTVCVYRVRVTEVFTGNYSEDHRSNTSREIGDIITTPGPDALTSCASPYGRVLQLNVEYLVGVGGPCGYFNEWSLLSSYEEEDLVILRSPCHEITCVYNGQVHYVGDTFSVDCNTCGCSEDGSIICTLVVCPTLQDELVWWHYFLIGVGVFITVLAVTVGLLLVIVLLFKRSRLHHTRLQDTSDTLSSEHKVLFKNGPSEAESVELKVPVADDSDPIKT